MTTMRWAVVALVVALALASTNAAPPVMQVLCDCANTGAPQPAPGEAPEAVEAVAKGCPCAIAQVRAHPAPFVPVAFAARASVPLAL